MTKKYYTASDLAKLITHIENRDSPFSDRAARELLSGCKIENKKTLKTGEPEILLNKKPFYYSEETILEALNSRSEHPVFSNKDVEEFINIIELIENEKTRITDEEKYIEDILNGKETNYYIDENPLSYNNIINPDKIKQDIKKIKVEVILEKILETLGYKFDEEEFFKDSIEVREQTVFLDNTDMAPIETLKKLEKLKKPNKYYIKKINNKI